MKSKIKILLAFAILLLPGLFACRDEKATSPTTQISLSDPTVFIPAGRLKSPQGIAVDGSGNVWVADTKNNKLRRFSPAGTQTDSMSYPDQVQKIAVDKRNGDLLVIHGSTTVDRVIAASKTVTASFPLNPFSGDVSGVFDANTGTTQSILATTIRLGDVDVSPMGDIYVSAYGSPENFVVRISNSNVIALAYSSLSPTAAGETGAHFLAVDGFGTVFTSFTFTASSSQNVTRVYSINPGNVNQSKVLNEPVVSGAARGATVDAAGNLYIADPLTQYLTVVSTSSEKTIGVYRIPDTNGLSVSPQDVAVTAGGTVYVVVTDRSGSDAGAVLKYIPQ
ncbi:MAG: SMP-30/gluconolactonase/LRE family protein [bacterium]